MQHIYYELSVLGKAIHFKNLSAAALHVGLSQPQLSRIIAKIEDELKIILLDRSAKRKSGWTPVAFQLSLMFEKSSRHLDAELANLSHNQIVADALESLRLNPNKNRIIFNLLPETFIMKDVQDLYETIFDETYARNNFQKKILDLNVLERIEKKFTGAANKAPYLYRTKF